MLDIRLFRDSPEKVKDMLEKRKLNELLEKVDYVADLDKRWRHNLQQTNELRAQRNKISEEIGKLAKEKKDISIAVKESKNISQKIKELEQQLQPLEFERTDYLKLFPNMIDESVPLGETDKDNVPIRWYGAPKLWREYIDLFKEYNRSATAEPIIVEKKPMGHADIVEKYMLADTEKASENAGSRFFYEINELADLDLALVTYTFNHFRKKGFKAIIPPYLVRKHVEEGATDFSVFEETLYKVEGEDLYLIPTSEHPITAYFSKTYIKESELPIRCVGFSPSFRREAGAHGKDTKGIFRVHQFHKVELYSVTHPKDSYQELENLTRLSEELMQELDLPYRVVQLCTGDMDKKVTKQYDIEGWFPNQGLYRELTSAGNVTDWQARRFDIKYQEKYSGDFKYPHTIYGTGVAIQRTLACILENYMQEDGTIKMPQILKPYLLFEEIPPKQ